MKKKIKALNRKIAKTNNAVQTFIKQTIKNYQSMKKKFKSIWLVALMLAMDSCGTTQVTVSKPSSGTHTTITVTTNNPTTTDVSPNIETTLKKGM